MKSSSRQRRVRPLKAKAATADAAAEFDNYGAEPNMKLSHAFMVVLALHVIAVGGLFAFNKVKAGHSKVSQKLQNEVASGQEAVMKEESQPLVPAPVHEVVTEVKKEVSLRNEQHLTSSEAVPAPAPLPTPAVARVKESPVAVVSTSPKKVTTSPSAPALSATQKAFLATKTASSTATAAPIANSSTAVTAVATMASSVVTTAEATPTASQAAPLESVASTEYTIVKGDNPYKLAKRFHVPYSELIKFNNITDPRKIQIGQKIRIPKRGAVKSEE
ncbi:MAG: LysM peptidoglycan-binding domain-containing protein [Verrucomicrobia bacterium]|nr:LysM peptidoglycan-binding domain-containing protein [Verrucomicrobiota bacterium]